MIEQIKALGKKHNELNAAVKAVSKDFEAYIVNKDIPLQERWAIFVAGHGVGLTDEFSDICFYDDSEGLEYLMDDIHESVPGRGAVVDMVSQFDCAIGQGYFTPLEFLSYKDRQKPEMQEKAEALLTDALEAVLRMNVGSFVFDW